MKKIITAVMILALCSVSAFPAKKKAPSWLLDINKVYPNSDYIAQLGEGSSKEEAEVDAVAHISRYFESNVDTTTIGRLYMSDKNSEIQKKSDIERTSTISSNVNLFAIKYSEAYKDKKAKKTYIVAFIERDEAYRIYRPKVDLPAQKFEAHYSKAKESEKNKDYLKAIKFYKEAEKYTVDFEEEYAFAIMLNSKKAKEYEKTHNEVCSIESEIVNALQKCQIEISVENDFEGIVAAKSETLFNNYGFPIREKNGTYKVLVKITLDERSFEKGTAYYPSVNVTISNEKETVIAFGKEGEKISAVNADVAHKRAYKKIEELLESAFAQEF